MVVWDHCVQGYVYCSNVSACKKNAFKSDRTNVWVHGLLAFTTIPSLQ